MRGVFGFLSLVVALAIVGLVAKKQLQAMGSVAPSVAQSPTPLPAEPGHRLDAFPGSVSGAGDIGDLTVPQQSRSLQSAVRESTAAALQQGRSRTAQGER